MPAENLSISTIKVLTYPSENVTILHMLNIITTNWEREQNDYLKHRQIAKHSTPHPTPPPATP